MGVGYMPLGLQLIDQGYTNLVVSVPSEGTGLEICSAAVINNAKNPENAKAIADILASPEWHQRAADTYAVGFMFASGVPCHGLEEFTDVKALKMDYVWAANNKDRLIAESSFSTFVQDNWAMCAAACVGRMIDSDDMPVARISTENESGLQEMQAAKNMRRIIRFSENRPISVPASVHLRWVDR